MGDNLVPNGLSSIQDNPSFSKYACISGSLVASAKRVHSAAREENLGFWVDDQAKTLTFLDNTI
jgi:hypothetical protein